MPPTKRQPDLTGRQTEIVQRVRLRYAKRGRLRFTSHRDVARAFERAIRRAGVPMAYSSGFTAHPRISWAGAAPTGAASEAEYVEFGLAAERDPAQLAAALDAALAPGIDVLEVVTAQEGTGKLADRIDASEWRLELTGVDEATAQDAVVRLLAAPEVAIERMTKDGRRTIDVRGPLTSAIVRSAPGSAPEASGVTSAVPEPVCAIVDVVVRQTTPVVRPDDVVAALSSVAGWSAPPLSLVTRLAQGRLSEAGSLVDPLAADRTTAQLTSEVLPVASHQR